MRVLLSRLLRAGCPCISWLQEAQIFIRRCIVPRLYCFSKEVSRKWSAQAGQSHLIDARQNALEIGVVPSSLETLGLDAYTGGVFLAQQIEANMT